MNQTLKIIIISDLHRQWHTIQIPECDILISCGDYSNKGEPISIKEYHEWLNKQNAKYIISVQGNHELFVEQNFNIAKDIATVACPRVLFIDEGPLEIEDIKIWCSSITPTFGSWAWMRNRGSDIKRHWDLIPDDTQILITHGPPSNILDEIYYPNSKRFQMNGGCIDLFNKIQTLKKLKLHCFGHLHHCGGQKTEVNGVTFINAAILNDNYQIANKPSIYVFNKERDDV